MNLQDAWTALEAWQRRLAETRPMLQTAPGSTT